MGVGVDVDDDIVDSHASAAHMSKKVTVADSRVPLGHGRVSNMSDGVP